MSAARQTIDQLLAEQADLRARLDEVNETLTAIRSGQVDALVVNGNDGPQVYILQAADIESNRFRSDILAKINDAVIAIDEEERLIYLNSAAEEHYGVTALDLLGKPVEELFQQRWSRPEDEQFFHQSLDAWNHWRGEVLHTKRNGETVHVESSVSRLIDKDGSPAGLLAVIRDVTQRHAAESALRESEERYRTLFDSIDEGFCILEMIGDESGRPRDFRFLQVNPAFVKQTGLPEMTGRTIQEVMPHREDEWLAVYERIPSSNEPIRFEYRAEPWDRWFEVCAFRLGQTERHQVAVLFTDISERREAEELRQRSHALFSDIIDQAPGGVIVVDDELRTYQVNATALPVFSSVKPLVGRPLHEVLTILWGPEAGERLVDIFGHTLTTGEPSTLTAFTEWRADLGIKQSYDWETRRIVLPGGGFGVVCYFTDTTEKSRAADALRESEQALADQAEALRQADRSKNEFLAMLAHELRNPLAPLRHAAAILESQRHSKPQRDQALELIVRQIGNMSRMIDDLLDVSRITEGKIELRRQAVSLQAVLTAAADTARPNCLACGQQLTLTVPEESLVVEGDPTRLEQILGNLLGNACKYSGHGSHITLAAFREDSSHVLIRVADDGVGIDPELLPRVFELFVQSSRTLDRAHGGLGIGLTIVHRLVKLHGGTIEAHSGGPGHGTEFLIRLPLLECGEETTVAEATPAAPVKGQRMLIVDDNRDAADSMAMLQELHGHETMTAYDGPSALAVASEFRPEVILLDIGLPGMDGYEVARQLRENPALAESFLIALTGYAGDDDQEKCRVSGFDAHLVKPADLELLRQMLEQRA